MPPVTKSTLQAGFGSSPREAVNFFQKKGFKLAWDWHETLDSANNRTFQVAKAIKMDVLTDIRSAVDKAIKNGVPFNEFKKQLAPTLVSRGWWGKKEMINPKTGEIQTVQLGSPHRLKTIYRTNVQSSYNAGRWKGQFRNRKRRPWLQLIEVLDASTRPRHRVQSGSIAKVTSQFWKAPNSWYPPNGFNCRGRVRALTEAQAKARGAPKIKARIPPDPGFGGNPGINIFKPVKSDYPPRVWKKAKKELKPPPKVEKKFTAQKTTERAEEWAKAQDLADVVEYKGLDVTTANALNESVFNHFERYPGLRPQMKYLGTMQNRRNYFKTHGGPDLVLQELKKLNPGVPEHILKKFVPKNVAKATRIQSGWMAMSTPAGGSTDMIQGVSVNANWGKNSAKFAKAIKEDVANGGSPKGADTIKSVMDHEMGHEIDRFVGARKQVDILTVRNEAGIMGTKDGLSKYALKNSAEFIAEAWTEFINSPAPREISRKVGKKILKLLEAKK